MSRKFIKPLLFILILSVGLTAGLLKLDALMDNTCRGTDWCQEAEGICLEGEMYYNFILGALCDGPGWCLTTIRISCWDEDAEEPYYGWGYCREPAASYECGSEL